MSLKHLPMLDVLYGVFFSGLLLYFFLTSRKELPFILLMYSILEYFLTQLFWLNGLSKQMSGLLLVFLVLSGFALVWARSLNYSREQKQARVLFRVSSWVSLLAGILVMWIRGPFVMEVVSQSSTGYGHGGWTFQPFLKLCTNGLLFLFFLQLLIGWGRTWSVRESLLDLSPFFIYVLLLLSQLANWPSASSVLVFGYGVG